MKIITTLFLLPVLAYLSFSTLFQLLLAVAGHFYRREKRTVAGPKRRFAVLIPAYREDAVIVETAQQAFRQSYPSAHYDVIVIADTLQASTIAALRQLPIKLIEVRFEKSTKVKALRAALEQLPAAAYEAVVILDADNIMAADFLQRINESFDLGYRAVQGQRKAKNLDTPMAILDGASEAANLHSFCRGARQLGWSARLMGSGMAFDYELFKQAMSTAYAVGGFDKELELELTYEHTAIGYAEEAIVLDEKVRNADTIGRQRSRWLSAQYQFLQLFGIKGLSNLIRLQRADFVHKVLLLALPPRLFLPAILMVGTVMSWMLGGAWWLIATWGGLLLLNLLTFALSLPAWFFQRSSWRAWAQAGVAFWQAIRALFMMKKARHQFIHTPHGTKKID